MNKTDLIIALEGFRISDEARLETSLLRLIETVQSHHDLFPKAWDKYKHIPIKDTYDEFLRAAVSEIKGNLDDLP